MAPPENLFNFSKDSAEIAYPYIQKIDVPVAAEICFIGDLHGSAHSLLRTIWRLLLLGYIDNNFKMRDNFYIVFLGDYSDRGNGTAEVWYSMINLKLKNWGQVFILRGNHDVWAHHEKWGRSTFLKELEYKYGNAEAFKSRIKCMYNLLPHALLIGADKNYILCAHGGANRYYDPTKLFLDGNSYELLSDEHNFRYGPGKKGWATNTFLSRWYGNQTLLEDSEYLNKFSEIKAVFRGHQHSKAGLCFFLVNKNFGIRHPIGKEKSEDVPLPDWQNRGITNGIVTNGEQEAIKNGTFKFVNKNFYPIFTLISATAYHSWFDCFCMVKMAENYSDWTLKLYQHNLKDDGHDIKHYKRAFASLSFDPNELLSSTYTPNPAINCLGSSLRDKIFEFSKATDKPEKSLQAEGAHNIQSKLTQLKVSLLALKDKFEQLSGKLMELKSKL
jgi:hypothetical protein